MADVFSIHKLVLTNGEGEWVPFVDSSELVSTIHSFWNEILVPLLRLHEELDICITDDTFRMIESPKISKHYPSLDISLIEGIDPYELILRRGKEDTVLYIHQKIYKPVYNNDDGSTHLIAK